MCGTFKCVTFWAEQTKRVQIHKHIHIHIHKEEEHQKYFQTTKIFSHKIYYQLLKAIKRKLYTISLFSPILVYSKNRSFIWGYFFFLSFFLFIPFLFYHHPK